jgi:formate hydrogenlyase subunit 3/multisubunit Na+/H+ antiporter MnhD subunit
MYEVARTGRRKPGYVHADPGIFVSLVSAHSTAESALRAEDRKRLLGYSTIWQIAYIFEGIGLGTKLGIYGGLFRAFTRLWAKGLLLFCAGAIIYRPAQNV